jgi:hypothetical protein
MFRAALSPLEEVTVSDRLRLVLIASALGFGSIACSESTPDTNGTTSGSGPGGAGSGAVAGSTSAGTGGMSGGAAGSSAGMGGMAMAGSGGAAGGEGGAGGASGAGGTGGSGGASPHGTKMSFFVSSTPPGAGTGKFGGLSGGDMHCKMLAMAAGAARTQWVAYLSVAGTNAKDRIGAGPWYNYDEEVFAADQAALHALPDAVAMRDAYIAAKPADALFKTETGAAVPGGIHDILTGTNPDGTESTGNTCGDWTLDTGGMRMVGHSDTPGSTQFSPSWNAAHSNPGCDADAVESTGGEGRIYCFATD